MRLAAVLAAVAAVCALAALAALHRGGDADPKLVWPVVYVEAADVPRTASVVEQLPHLELAVLATDGERRRLTENGYADYWPAVSPDGKRIAFTANRDRRGDVYGDDDLFVMTSGGAPTPLNRDGAKGPRDLWPAWSPDGRRVVFASARIGDAGAEQFDLFIVDAATGRQRRLTSTSGDESMPAWSPDGHTIAFVGVGRGGFDLYRRAAAGGPAERLTTTGGRSPDEGFPAFSPDGSALVYSAVRHGTAAAVYQLDLRTRRETLLAADDVSLVRPRFSPDGRFLLFVRYPAQWAYAPIVPLAGEVVVQELASGRRLRVADGGDADWLAPRR